MVHETIHVRRYIPATSYKVYNDQIACTVAVLHAFAVDVNPATAAASHGYFPQFSQNGKKVATAVELDAIACRLIF
jgi:hypothetical protein